MRTALVGTSARTPTDHDAVERELDLNARRRSAPFNDEPGFYGPAELWLFGNVKLLEGRLGHIANACGPSNQSPCQLEKIEREAEELVLGGKVLVCGIHNPAHMRAAVVPLRWGSPRIVVMSGGFRHHLGKELRDEPFRAARLWRRNWDPWVDLAVSRRAPDKKPTYASYNPTVDRLIARLAAGERVGVLSPLDPSKPYLG